jgi:hypothetical protein
MFKRVMPWVMVFLTAAAALSFSARTVRFSAGSSWVEIPVPFFSIPVKNSQSGRLAWIIEENIYLGRNFSSRGWIQTDQMGSMHYYSNGVTDIGVLRTKTALFTYCYIITIENHRE